MSYDTQVPSQRLTIRQGLWLAQQPFASSTSYGSGTFKKRRICLGIDSLTDGGAGSTFRTYLKPLLDAKHGDAGIPAGAFSNLSDGLVTFSQSGISGMGSLGWTDASRIKSPFGGGYYAYNVTTSNLNLYATTINTDIVAMSIWVEFTAAGQSFYIRPANASGSTMQMQIFGDNYPLNTPVKITYPLNASYYSGINLNAINTNGANYIYFWWREFHYNTPRSGVELVDLGLGGATMANWAGLDDTASRRWWRIMQPDMIMLNGGMNDRGSGLSNGNVYVDKVPNSVTFAHNLNIVLDRIPSSPNVMLVIPNEPIDVATTGIGYYPDIIKSAAEQRGWAWHDDRAVLGAYATANVNGDMGDGVHPSAQGNNKRAVAYDARIQATVV